MRFLVTGATGFVGSHVARVLAKEGHQVRALVRPGGNTLNIENTGVEVALGDVREPESVKAAVKGCDGVFHVAALYTFWSPRPQEFHETNVMGTRNVLQVALETGVKRVVHTSTWAVVGGATRGRLATEASQAKPGELKGAYRWSKYLAELEALAFADKGLEVVVVNPTVPVGPGDAKPTPTGRLILDFLRGRIPAYVDTCLNLIAVEDVAWGHYLAFQRGRSGERYILGHRNMTLKEVLQSLAAITGKSAPRLRVPIGLATVAAYLDNLFEGALLRRQPRIPLEGVLHARRSVAADCSKAVKELGLPQSPVEEALERAVGWFYQHGYVK